MRAKISCQIGGAEAGFGEDGVGGGALADGGGEFAAVVDQLADQAEQAAAAAGLGGRGWGFGRGGHERNKNTSGRRDVKENIPAPPFG